MTPVRFRVEFIDGGAAREYLALDGSIRPMIDKGIARLALRADEIGKPLKGQLSGCRELKFRADGTRIVFRIIGKSVQIVQIVAIGRRDKGSVFDVASRRLT